LRGVEAELDGGLIGRLAKVGEQVANLLLAGVENLTGRGLVHGVSDVVAELLEVLAQLGEQGVSGELRWGGHGRSGGKGRGKNRSRRNLRPG
jgi:hypothetical protein